MSVSESSVVIGHSDEVIAARRLPVGRILPQEAAREVQVSATTTHAGRGSVTQHLTSFAAVQIRSG